MVRRRATRGPRQAAERWAAGGRPAAEGRAAGGADEKTSLLRGLDALAAQRRAREYMVMASQPQTRTVRPLRYGAVRARNVLEELMEDVSLLREDLRMEIFEPSSNMSSVELSRATVARATSRASRSGHQSAPTAGGGRLGYRQLRSPSAPNGLSGSAYVSALPGRPQSACTGVRRRMEGRDTPWEGVESPVQLARSKSASRYTVMLASTPADALQARESYSILVCPEYPPFQT